MITEWYSRSVFESWKKRKVGARKWWKEVKTRNTKENSILFWIQMLIGETPSNPRISVLDVEALGKLGQETGITTLVDSTYASPYLLQPIKYGVDIVAHSA